MTTVLDDRSARQRPRAPAAGSAPAMLERSRGLMPVLLALFVIGLALPNVIFLGGIRLSPYRLVLLIAFVPLLVAWLSGKNGRIYGFDICIALFALWGALSLLAVHGVSNAREAAVILIVETLGAFLLGRMAIRNATDYVRMLRLHVWVIFALFPFTIHETMTGRPLLVEIAQKFGPAIGIVTDPARMGLERVQGPFEHSILFGAFCASAFAGSWYVLNWRRSAFIRLAGVAPVLVSTFLSLSSAALMAAVLQVILMIYERVTRALYRRWTWFAAGCMGIYVFIDLLSNRNPFHVITSYLTFNTGSAYNRILIWRYGTENVAQNPIFGLGFGEWVRPDWMGNSVDNFWLLIAMRHGLPGIGFLMLGTFLVIRRISWAEVNDPFERACRATCLTVLGGLILASTTVHYWNSMYVWFMFLIGSGSWALENVSPAGTEMPETGRSARRTRHGRSTRAGRTGQPDPADAPDRDSGDTPPPAPASPYTRGPRISRD